MEIPDDLVDLLTTDVLGHVSALRRDGSIAHSRRPTRRAARHTLSPSTVMK